MKRFVIVLCVAAVVGLASTSAQASISFAGQSGKKPTPKWNDLVRRD